MAEAAAGILYGIEKVVETAVVAAKGIYDPTLPLKATLKPLTSIDVAKTYHTVSVIKGRAYLFGGKTVSKDGGSGEEQLADNDMHIVILPFSGVESVDYKRIAATSETPPKRFGHCASVIEDRMYVFGGNGENGEPMDEGGRVWVYEAQTDKWSYFDPPRDSQKPEPRSACASVASEHPRPATKVTAVQLPQQPPDPEVTMPEIAATDSYGTLIILGGRGKSGTLFNDIWSFDISIRTWTQLPDPPPPTSPSPSLSLVGNRLHSFSIGQTSYLDLTESSFDDRGGRGELGLAPLGPWLTLPPASSSPDKYYPGDRAAAPMLPVTTGQGRHYLLLIGGQSQSGEVCEDIWSLQLKPEAMTVASFKDAARMAISKDTHEAEWDEVQYLNADGVMIQEGQSGRSIGTRKGLAAAKGTEVDGASVVVWGGIGADGQPRGDGLMVTVDR